MIQIGLTKGQIAIIDDEDFEKVNKYSWCVISSRRNRFYAKTVVILNDQKKKKLLLQHLIVGRAPQGKRLFFKDGNPLNCQKNNLEFISPSQASHIYYKKTKTSKNTTAAFRGVVVKYIAQIKYQNRIIALGNYTSEREAAIAYNHKATELFGDKAILNIVTE